MKKTMIAIALLAFIGSTNITMASVNTGHEVTCCDKCGDGHKCGKKCSKDCQEKCCQKGEKAEASKDGKAHSCAGHHAEGNKSCCKKGEATKSCCKKGEDKSCTKKTEGCHHMTGSTEEKDAQ